MISSFLLTSHDRISIKLQLTGKSRLTFIFYRVTTGDRRSHDRDRQQAGSRQLCVHKRSFHFIASHADVLFEAPPQFPSLCLERSLLKVPCDQNIERGGGGEMHKLQSPNYCLKSRFSGTVSVKFMIDPGCKQIYVKHRIF